MEDDTKIPSDSPPTLADFKTLEVEHGELQERLEVALERVEAHEAEALDASIQQEGDRIEIAQAKHDLSEATDTIASQGVALREKEALLAWVLNSTVDGVVVYRSVPGDDGAIVDFEVVLHNPAATKLYAADKLEGARLLALHPDLHEVGFWDQYLQVFESGQPFEGDYRHVRGGEVHWSRVLAIKIGDGIAITFSDISHRKQMETQIREQLEELRRADRMKDEFLAVISHELRTPIHGLMGFLSILEDELAGPLDDAQHAYLAKASERAEAMFKMVESLLDMSRLQAGKLHLEPVPFDFAEVAGDVLAHLIPAPHTHHLANEVPAGLPPVVADPLRTKQVLANLVRNATKFSPPEGAITVRARVEGDFLRCEVVDTGIGIPEAALPQLFQVFTQVDMSSTRSVGGVGLGLSIAKHLVEAQGGAIGVESREGEGSTFWFTLPLQAA